MPYILALLFYFKDLLLWQYFQINLKSALKNCQHFSMDSLKIMYKEWRPVSIFLLTLNVLTTVGLCCGKKEETQSGRCLLHASAASRVERGRGWEWSKVVWQVAQHCPHVKRSRWLRVYNVTRPLLFSPGFPVSVYQQRAITCIFLAQQLLREAVPFY